MWFSVGRTAALVRLLLFAFCFAALALFPSAGMFAQDTNTVVFYHGTYADDFSDLSGQLDVISLDDGSLTTIALPPDWLSEGSRISAIAVSPDHRYLVANTQLVGTDTANPLMIYDLESGNCCVTVPDPVEDVAAITLGGFSPDGAQFSAAWIGFVSRDTYEFVGGMMTVDVASGQIVHSVSSADVSAALNEEFPSPWAFLGGWEEDGIRFVPNCFACEGVFEGEWLIWNPETNTFTTSSGEYFNVIFGDLLPATSEMLLAAQNPQFPMNNEPSYLPIPNVILYVHDRPLPRSFEPSDAPVIFADPNRADLTGGAHWVLDGEAALITPSESDVWTLLYRDGTQQTVNVPVNSEFLVGTPNGWLSLNNEPGGRVITLYTVDGAPPVGTRIGSPLAEAEYLRLLDAPALGTRLTHVSAVPSEPAIFPTLTPPEGSQSASTDAGCGLLTPTRVAPNIRARVTPGTPNNLRSEPSTSAPLIGTIPGGAEFLVIMGPSCDENSGIVWWQVEYGSQIGWTAESQNGAYFIEPVGVG
jgi:hypothetical protein